MVRHFASCVRGPGSNPGTADVFRRVTYSGIFLENNFKYQNSHNNELAGAISANYRGFFPISCLLFDILRGGMAP